MEDYRYALWVLFVAGVWLPLVLIRRDLFKQSLILGIFVAVMTPFVGWWYLQDYWDPVFTFEIQALGLRTGVEEIALGFFIGAISSIAYEVVARKKLIPIKKPYSWAFPILILSAMYAVGAGLVIFTGINSIYASFISFAVAITLLLILRRDLFIDGLVSGVLFSLVLFFSYVLWLEMLFPGTMQEWWNIENISGIVFMRVPIEEIIWGFLWGFTAGMLYETWKGLAHKKSSS